MEHQQNENKWRENLEEIFLILHRKVYIFIFSVMSLLFIGLSLQKAFLQGDGMGSVIGAVVGQLACAIVMIFIAFRINSKKTGDYYYTFLVAFVDTASIILCYSYNDQPDQYSRLVYHYICYAVMFMNIKSDHTWGYFIFLFCFKVVGMGIILIFYNFKLFYTNCIVLDFYMIGLCFGMIIVNRYVKFYLLQSLEAMNEKNVSLTTKLKNIFNTMKSPLFSINFKEKIVFFNNSFIKFIKEKFNQEEFGTKFLFNEVNENEYTEEQLKNLMENLPKGDFAY